MRCQSFHEVCAHHWWCHVVWPMKQVVQAFGKVSAGARGILWEAGIARSYVHSVSSIKKYVYCPSYSIQIETMKSICLTVWSTSISFLRKLVHEFFGEIDTCAPVTCEKNTPLSRASCWLENLTEDDVIGYRFHVNVMTWHDNVWSNIKI